VLFSKLFGKNSSKRIRKDAGDLRAEDFEQFPAWEFCLDEEGVKGQTECTMRPLLHKGPLRWPDFDGMVAADMVAANGQKFLGLVAPTEEFDDPWRYGPEIMLPELVGQRVSHPLLEQGWNPMLMGHRPRIGFHIPAEKEENISTLISLAYQALGTTAQGLWPITVTPRVVIADIPPSWQFDGWLRGRGPGGKLHVLR